MTSWLSGTRGLRTPCPLHQHSSCQQEAPHGFREPNESTEVPDARETGQRVPKFANRPNYEYRNYRNSVSHAVAAEPDGPTLRHARRVVLAAASRNGGATTLHRDDGDGLVKRGLSPQRRLVSASARVPGRRIRCGSGLRLGVARGW